MARGFETLRLEVPEDAVDTVLAALGSLPVAAQMEIRCESTLAPPAVQEERAYNPDRVKWVVGVEGGSAMPVITKECLLASDILTPELQTRHVRAVWNELERIDRGYRVTASVLSLPTYFMRYFDTRARRSEYALLAETAEELVYSPVLTDVRNIGAQAIGFYRAYVADLFVGPSDS
jgi:hypothetical protein